MHNGCLLLLAFVAVFQPIASYTERGFVDGRQQRCDYRTSLRDPGGYFHGTYRFTKPAVEDRRLNTREDVREVRWNEVRGDDLRTSLSSDRRLVDTLERNRISLTRLSRDRGNDAVLRRELRESRRISIYRDELNQNTRERLSTVQETHQDHRLSRQDNSRLLEDGSRQQNRIDNRRSNAPRDLVETRRDTRRNGNIAEVQRVKEYRHIRLASNRARDDAASRLIGRRIAREEVQRMDTRRSVSRIQLNRNMDREVLIDQRSRNTEIRSSSTSSDRVNRAFSNKDSHLATRDSNRSLDRLERRSISSRRSVDERQVNDISRIQRQRLTDQRRYIRDSANLRKMRDQRDRTSDNRRDAQLIGRARSTERDARLRAVRSVDRLPQNERRDSRIYERARSAENRVELRQARSINEIRSLDRSAENQMDTRRSIRARVAEARNAIREIGRESQTIQAEIRNNNRDACALEHVRATEHRMARILTRERAALSERNSQNMELENRIRGLERVSQRDAQILREVHSINPHLPQENRREARVESRRISQTSDSRASRTARSVENQRDSRKADSRLVKRRDIRNVDSRMFRTERSIENRRDSRDVDSRRSDRSDESRRDNRNIDSRAFITESSAENRRDSRSVNLMARRELTDESQREARNVESRAFKSERTADSRRESRDYERQSRSLDRVAHRRDSRNNERDARMQDRTFESRRNIEAQSRNEDELIISNRRTRSLERQTRSLGRERSMESRLNMRTARHSRTFVLERRERAAENRRDARNIRTEFRPDTRLVNNMVQSRDEVTERLNKRDSLDSRRNYNLQRESRKETRRTSERDTIATRHMDAETRSFNAEFARKREVQSMFQSPKQSDDEAPAMNWQYLFYTLQGLYICGVLIQLMDERSADKKTRASWWPTPQHLIKVD